MSVTQIVIGDVLQSQAQTLVNTVNCAGVMGKGIALEFKRRFPQMYADYVQRCARGEVRLGEPYLFADMVGPWVLNFPTKGHWRSASREADIEAGIRYLEEHCREWGITSLAMPPLGCGNGGLEWRRIGPLLFQHLSQFDIPVEMYAPYGTPPDQLSLPFLSQVANVGSAVGSRSSGRVEPSWVALVEIVSRITRRKHHWPVGRVTFQKIAYFATMEGLPTGLRYARASYGPFAADLKRVTNRLVNADLLQEEQRGSMIAVKRGPEFDRVAGSLRGELQHWDSLISRVTDLFLRISSTSEAELAASISFAARELRHACGAPPTEMDVLDEVLAWKLNRKPPFTREHVAESVRDLAVLGWLDVRPSLDLPLGEDLLVEV